MFDLKPDAPAEVRGEFKPIATTAPGIQICEHLPRTAKWMHKAAIVRSVNHKAGCHNCLPSYTGFERAAARPAPARHRPAEHGLGVRVPARRPRRPARLRLPAVLARLGPGVPPGRAVRRLPRPALRRRSPPSASRSPTPGAKPAPGKPAVVRGAPLLPNTALAADLTLDRLERPPRRCCEQFDDQLRQLDADAAGRRLRPASSSGPSTCSPRRGCGPRSTCRRKTRGLLDRYGRTLFGHSTLIARRLVEEGVRFVNVTWDLFWDRVQIDYDAWDTHTKNFAILKDEQAAALRPDVHGPAGRPGPRAACSTRRWWW